MKAKIVYWGPPDFIEYEFETEIFNDTINLIDTLRSKFNFPIRYEIKDN